MPEWLRFDASTLGINEWIAIVSAALAILSFLFNWAVVRRQTALQSESLKGQLDANVLDWGSEAMDVLTDCVWLACNRGASIPAEEFAREHARSRAKLSAIIDKGRLFFPNRVTATKGEGKARAFRGGRPFVLNPLVFAFFELDTLDPAESSPATDAGDFLVACRREFVSELQHHLDPRRRRETLRRLGLSHDKMEESYDDSLELALKLEARHPGLLERRGDDGWAKNVKRAQDGDRTPFQPLGR